ncbi:hypothetical protein CRUP_017122, partial [Coryphaenoides rupestris]
PSPSTLTKTLSCSFLSLSRSATSLGHPATSPDTSPGHLPGHLPGSPVSNILDSYLNTTSPVKALKGERLALNCTAVGSLNTRVNITWEFPGMNNSNTTSSVRKHIMKGRTEILFYSVLTLPVLQRSDRGRYTCRVTSGPKAKWVSKVNVHVYDRPFIRLRARNGTLGQVFSIASGVWESQDVRTGQQAGAALEEDADKEPQPEALTCDVNVDGDLPAGAVAVAAAEGPGVSHQRRAEGQAAAVVLARAPAAGLFLPQAALRRRYTVRERPRQLPAAPGERHAHPPSF